MARLQRPSLAIETIPESSRRIETALAELAAAHDYARDAGCDAWQFAVEISRLQELGLTRSDLRWLVEKGFAAHACEATRPGDRDRQFAAGANTAFSPDARFVLTDAGLDMLDGGRPEPTLLRFARQCSSPPENAPIEPRWDGKTGMLTFGERVVKRFARAARNQETVLDAFQEEGWPYRIDDPLPHLRNVNSKRRLHDTIKWLNRDHEIQVVAFIGDGTGEGIRWKSLIAGEGVHSAVSSQRFRRAA